MSILSSLTPTQLRQAADLKEKIGTLQNELAVILGSAPDAAPEPKTTSKMSARTRAKMAAAQKARWAKVKVPKPAPAATQKRIVSAAVRAKMAAAAKARWATAKAAGMTTL